MNEAMTILCRKRCIIGEGPIWNEREQLLYFVNGYENEICIANIDSGEFSVNKLPPPKTGVAAIAFGKNGDIIVSRSDGVFILRGNEYIPLYDRDKYKLLYCNDMKVGPDGRLYVGTLSEKKRGVSEKKPSRKRRSSATTTSSDASWSSLPRSIRSARACRSFSRRARGWFSCCKDG